VCAARRARDPRCMNLPHAPATKSPWGPERLADGGLTTLAATVALGGILC